MHISLVESTPKHHMHSRAAHILPAGCLHAHVKKYIYIHVCIYSWMHMYTQYALQTCQYIFTYDLWKAHKNTTHILTPHTFFQEGASVSAHDEDISHFVLHHLSCNELQ